MATYPDSAPDGSSLSSDHPDLPDDPYPRLSYRHQRFVDALVLNGGNQTQAWLSAGYTPESPQSAAVDASRALTDANVRRAYDLRRAELANRASVSREAIAAELFKVGFQPMNMLDRWCRASDKTRALQLLGQLRGMWEEKSEREGQQLILNINVSANAHASVDGKNVGGTVIDLKPDEHEP